MGHYYVMYSNIYYSTFVYSTHLLSTYFFPPFYPPRKVIKGVLKTQCSMCWLLARKRDCEHWAYTSVPNSSPIVRDQCIWKWKCCCIISWQQMIRWGSLWAAFPASTYCYSLSLHSLFLKSFQLKDNDFLSCYWPFTPTL